MSAQGSIAHWLGLLARQLGRIPCLGDKEMRR
jgi:hypothetical protein